MIVDTLDNLERYISLNPLFPEVVKFIKENDLTQLEAGKHPIQGADLFLNIAELRYVFHMFIRNGYSSRIYVAQIFDCLHVGEYG